MWPYPPCAVPAIDQRVRHLVRDGLGKVPVPVEYKGLGIEAKRFLAGPQTPLPGGTAFQIKTDRGNSNI